MKITINSIEANIIDTSTMSESSFIIDDYKVSYEVQIKGSTMSGRLQYSSITALDPKVIIDFIKNMYEGVEEKLILYK